MTFLRTQLTVAGGFVHRWLVWPGWDMVIRVLVVASFSAGILAYYKIRDLAACQQVYNDSINVRTRVLSEAADGERNAEASADAAQAALWTSPLIGKPAAEVTDADRAAVLKLFGDYQRALSAQLIERAQADAARAAHPVPPPPSQTCT